MKTGEIYKLIEYVNKILWIKGNNFKERGPHTIKLGKYNKEKDTYNFIPIDCESSVPNIPRLAIIQFYYKEQ